MSFRNWKWRLLSSIKDDIIYFCDYHGIGFDILFINLLIEYPSLTKSKLNVTIEKMIEDNILYRSCDDGENISVKWDNILLFPLILSTLCIIKE